MGDGHDYAVWYKGMIVDYVKAMTDRKAANLAKKIYGPDVSVSRV